MRAAMAEGADAHGSPPRRGPLAGRPGLREDRPAGRRDHARARHRWDGRPPREDQTVVISGGKIAALGPTASTPVPQGAVVLQRERGTVLPGLGGMHDHLFYPAGGAIFHEMPRSFPRLYLAGGVTTIRTTGSIEPYTDLQVKKEIDAGKQPGPRVHVTGPYLEGQGTFTTQMHEMRDRDAASRPVEL